MATNIFKNSTLSGVGTTDTNAYITPTGKKSLLLQFDIVNTTTSSPVNVDAFIYNAATATKVYLFKNVPVSAGYPLEVVMNGKKVVLASDDRVGVKSNTAASVNVMVSVLEDVN